MNIKRLLKKTIRVLTLRSAVALKARKSRPGDAAKLAPNLREADVQEIKSASGLTPLEALTAAYEISSPCYTVVVEDEDQTIVAMFGTVATGRPDTGVVWLLAAPLLLQHSKEFIKQSDVWLTQLHQKYPILWNFVDKRNKTHIGWLKLIGVNFVGEDPEHGIDRLPFLEFIHV